MLIIDVCLILIPLFLELLVSNITISFFDEASGDTTTLSAPTGKSVLDIALEHNLNIEGIVRLITTYEYVSSKIMLRQGHVGEN